MLANLPVHPSDVILRAPPPTPTSSTALQNHRDKSETEMIFDDFPRFHVPWKRTDDVRSNKTNEMSPEVTLVEFISTSAAFHGVRSQTVRQLEDDIRRVCENNVMPANAAAWYMAKRRFYQNEPFELQLLPYLLKHYPKKFRYNPNNRRVEFMELYKEEVAKQKMEYLVHQGLFAYFSHKAEEFGVYFFDPVYYEQKEPFFANLKIATQGQDADRGRYIHCYMEKFKDQFYFKEHSSALVSVSKADYETATNCYGVIVSTINNEFGVIQFKNGSNTEKAIFWIRSLFVDGYPISRDPLRLPPIRFDGYKTPKDSKLSSEYTWFAVLVWSGLKPSPRFCTTRATLESAFYIQNLPVLTSMDLAHAKLKVASEKSQKASPDKKEKSEEEFMKFGEVKKIHSNGAVVTMNQSAHDKGEGATKQILIPGWSHRFRNRRANRYLTTTQGFLLSKGDIVAFRLDLASKADPYDGVGQNILVLKHSNASKSNARLTSVSEVSVSGDSDFRKGILRTSESSVDGKAKVKLVLPPKKVSYRDFLLTSDLDKESDSEEDPAFVSPDLSSDEDQDEEDGLTDEEIEADELKEILDENLKIYGDNGAEKKEKGVVCEADGSKKAEAVNVEADTNPKDGCTI